MPLANAFPPRLSCLVFHFRAAAWLSSVCGNQSWKICWPLTIGFGIEIGFGFGFVHRTCVRKAWKAKATNKWQFVVDLSSIIQNIWFTFASCRIWQVLLGFVLARCRLGWMPLEVFDVWSGLSIQSTFGLISERFSPSFTQILFRYSDTQTFRREFDTSRVWVWFSCGLHSAPITKLGHLHFSDFSLECN